MFAKQKKGLIFELSILDSNIPPVVGAWGPHADAALPGHAHIKRYLVCNKPSSPSHQQTMYRVNISSTHDVGCVSSVNKTVRPSYSWEVRISPIRVWCS